jgi:hypothetical protein
MTSCIERIIERKDHAITNGGTASLALVASFNIAVLELGLGGSRKHQQ